jgi:Tfp pilus assembly protein PilV
MRSGLNLLEVVVSLAIFLFSLTAIFQLMSMAGADVMESNVRARAALLCQSKLAEVQAGIVSVEGGSGWAVFPDDSSAGFEWMMTSDPNEDVPGSLVYNVEITVKKMVPGRGAVEVTIGQMVMDPSKKGSSLDPAIPSAQTTQ